MKVNVGRDATAVVSADEQARTQSVGVVVRQQAVLATASWSSVEPLVAALSLTAVAVPFWAGRFLPFLDLPQHLALSTIIAHYADPAARFATFYRIDWRVTPYWGFYATMHLLMVTGLGAVSASRLLFTAYAVTLPLSVAYLLTTLNRDWRWAAFTLPLVFNANLFWGFAGFTLSLPLFVYALALTIRTVEAAEPRRDDRWRLAGAAVLVYLFHAQTYVLLGLCVAALIAVHWQGPSWSARRVAPFALSVLLFAAWASRTFMAQRAAQQSMALTATMSGAPTAEPATLYEPVGRAIASIPDRVLGMYNDGSDYRIAALLLALFVVAVAVAGPQWRIGRARLVEHRGELLCGLLLGSYFLTPIKLGGQWWVSPRHLTFAALLAPTLLAKPAVGPRKLVVALACAVGMCAGADAAAKIRAFQAQVGPFDVVLDRMEPGRRVMNLMFDTGGNGPVRYWPFLHWGCYYQVEKGGDVSFSFANLPAANTVATHAIPVKYRPGRQPPRPDEWKPQEFRWDTMGASYDYFLIHGRPARDAARLSEHADLLVQAGDWRLWRRRIALP